MGAVRHFIFGHRMLATLVVAAALAMKLLVPAGFMPELSGGRITLQICSGLASAPMAMAMPAMSAMSSHVGDDRRQNNHPQNRADAPCAFAGLALAALAAVDPIQLRLAIAFLAAIGMRPAPARRVPGGGYLRPPLRGPPQRI